MVAFNGLKFVRDQWSTLPDPTGDLTGLVAVVTGSNSGLGYEAALKISRQNPARLILAVRNLTAGDEAAQKIYTENGGACQPEVWKLDQGDMKSVKEFADKMKMDLERLDILLLNAGVQMVEKKLTADGYETGVYVNNITTSLLATLAIPLLKKTTKLAAPVGTKPFKPRVVLVSSELHLQMSELPGMKEGAVIATMKDSFEGAAPRYIETKVINMLDVRTLMKIVKDDSVLVAAVNPGFCHSSLHRDDVGLKVIILTLAKSFMARTTEVGGRTLAWAAISTDLENGTYSSNCTNEEPSDFVLSEVGQKTGDSIWKEYEKIWKESVGVDAEIILGTSV